MSKKREDKVTSRSHGKNSRSGSCMHNVEDDSTQCTRVSKIKLVDKGSIRFAVFLNPLKQEYIKRRMDGGIVKNATSADWMLSREDAGDVVVELKGGDVHHALEQVIATAEFATRNGLLCGKIAALILCTQHPGIDTKIQRAMSSFARRFRGPIHTRNRSGEFVFDRVLSFNGPEGS